MKIKTIEINNYKAFYKKYKLNVDGKNLFIYGENGSGKSSLYYAVKDFFQSSRENIDLNEVENIFLTKREKGKSYIKVTFNPDKDGNPIDKLYSVTTTTKDTITTTDKSISDAIGLKSFLTYKHLLGIHNIKKKDEIDLFDLLVNGVLKHFKSVAITGSKELGELWEDVTKAIEKPLNGRIYTIANKKSDVETALRIFNTAFSTLFKEPTATRPNPDYILIAANPILQEFHHNIEIKLNYTQARPKPDFLVVENNHVRVTLWYLKKKVDKPHLFLNEARLSAIAISIYLGMIKRHPQINIKSKILFLDDIFIGLDISNRLPLLEILKNHFPEYQIFITTYDKPWYEFIKFYLDGNRDWKLFEFYGRRTRKGFEVPVVIGEDEKAAGSHVVRFIKNAEDYFNAGDNKAAGVYLRTAFEYILKRFCYGKVPIKFMLSSSDLDTEDFWAAIKKYQILKPTKCLLTPATATSIEHFRKLVLNPLSHHEINKHEISSEISGAIAIIKTLKLELGV